MLLILKLSFFVLNFHFWQEVYSNLKTFSYPKINYCPDLVDYATLSTDLEGLHTLVHHAFHIASVRKRVRVGLPQTNACHS